MGGSVLTWRLWRAKGSRQCSGDQTLATVVTIRVCVVCNFIPQNFIIIILLRKKILLPQFLT